MDYQRIFMKYTFSFAVLSVVAVVYIICTWISKKRYSQDDVKLEIAIKLMVSIVVIIGFFL